jgi:hypothetical protein
MPLRKNPHTRTDPVLANIGPTMPLRFAPPEKPANATGQRELRFERGGQKGKAPLG